MLASSTQRRAPIRDGRRRTVAEPVRPPAPEGEPTADELRALVGLLDLTPIPDHLLPRVLAAVRTFRASMRRLDEAGVELADVVTAQPFRAEERGGGR
jgi:hypothetical protein